MQIFLALVLAHLVGDFVVQRKRVIEGKRDGRFSALLEHGAWHLACLVVAWLLFAPAGIAAWQPALAFALIVSAHLAVDWLKYRYQGRRLLTAFVLDQLAHLAVLLLAAWWLAGRLDWLTAISDFWRQTSDGFGWLLVVYLVVVVACGWLNRLLLASLLPQNDGGSEGLARAGLYIGWLERFLMFTAFLAQAWTAIGLVLAAKSVFRFDSVRQQREHAEYFVIGTLLSASQVVVIGLIYQWLTPTMETGGL